MMQATVASTARCPQAGSGVINTAVKTTRAVSCKPFARVLRAPAQMSQSRQARFRAQAQPTEQADYIDYEGKSSVFLSEACEDTGEGCDIKGMGKDVNPSPSIAKPKAAAKPGPDREYQEYTEEKTVFPGEACDELGGEFCEPTFQEGVYPEKAGSKK